MAVGEDENVPNDTMEPGTRRRRRRRAGRAGARDSLDFPAVERDDPVFAARAAAEAARYELERRRADVELRKLEREAASTGSPVGSDVSTLLLLELRGLRAALERPPAPAATPPRQSAGAALSQWAPIIVQVAQGVIGWLGRRETMMLELLRGGGSTSAAPDASLSGLAALIPAVKSILEFAQDLGATARAPEAESANGMVEFRKILESVATLRSTAHGSGRDPVGAPGAGAPGGPAMAAAPRVATPPGVAVDPIMHRVAIMLEVLEREARARTDPYAIADQCVDDLSLLPGAVQEALLDADSSTLCARLAPHLPPLLIERLRGLLADENVKRWFDAFLEGLRTEEEEDGDEEHEGNEVAADGVEP